MKEARIILPLQDNAGIRLDAVHRRLIRMLVNNFGGFTTITRGRGAWKDSDAEIAYENVEIYDVAVDGSDAGKLRDIAASLVIEAGQEAIYYRGPDGEVELLTESL